MPAIDIIDETFVGVPAARLVDEVTDEERWSRIGLDCDCYEDRGDAGRRWRLRGAYHGTAEVWLESVTGGTIVHAYVRAEPQTARNVGRQRRRLHRAWKREMFAIKRRHDARRPPGEPPGP